MEIERFPESLQNVANVLTQSPHSNVRKDAAMALRHFSCQETVRILKDALNDEDSLVRYHAARSLLAIHGLLPDVYDTPASAIKVMSENTDQQGVEELNKLLSGKSLQPCSF